MAGLQKIGIISETKHPTLTGDKTWVRRGHAEVTNGSKMFTCFPENCVLLTILIKFMQ